MSKSMRIYFKGLTDNLEKDKAQMQQDGESLIALKDSLTSAKNQMSSLISKVGSNESRLDAKISDLTCKLETLNNENINPDNVRSFFNFSKKNGMALLDIEDELKANLDTQYTLQEVLYEREQDADKQIKTMNRLWAKEWDLRLTKKYVIKKRMY